MVRRIVEMSGHATDRLLPVVRRRSRILLIGLACALLAPFPAAAAVVSPNLVLSQAVGWSDKIVVKTAADATGESAVDSPSLTTADTLYFNWVVFNSGDSTTGSSFYVAVYVDGVIWGSATSFVAPSMNPGYGYAWLNWKFGKLSPGSHTIRVVADSTNTIAESNESDNSYTRTIHVSGASGPPNLTPFRLSGWSDKIVVRTSTGATADSAVDSPSLRTTDTLYLNWAIINAGATATSSTFYVAVYVDGEIWGSPTSFYDSSALNPTYVEYWTDRQLGSLPAGSHTIRIVADSTNAIAESNESDNSYTRTIQVTGTNGAHLIPYAPSGWSSPLVVSRVKGTHTDDPPFSSNDALSIDWAFQNNGTAAAPSPITYQLYVDGVLRQTWTTSQSLLPTYYNSIEDFALGTLVPGSHVLTLKADTTNTIAESSASKQYSRTIVVTQAPCTPGVERCGVRIIVPKPRPPR